MAMLTPRCEQEHSNAGALSLNWTSGISFSIGNQLPCTNLDESPENGREICAQIHDAAVLSFLS